MDLVPATRIDLEAYLAVVKNGSIGAAAQELCFSGASVPARIGVREVVSHYATCR
ncbi:MULTISPECIES: helix-turn-helix domain-containing protein [Brevibacterium]|uniref:Uncharacterized protein n=2 Tax=Micrococcales TaxID=85006 RepID=A0A1D7W1C5_BREAU|nr:MULTISPECIES: LysR family transcriptional regulator [Brevibacterium]MDN6534373.1 LysR family transcriptional regulator [Yaniella sp.]AOP52821.1 hypothetical protein BLSMQ_1109 [Brevibacterium aurantiacum]MDN5807401.1 LysR family transcriptional regulator [Brevibacterium sp.]MDN5833988.1 LysR family transcriptional regulator [Brevibacterium sp.]MDN5876294.1 LysR family transcriptional regulator [Brevibacterium sp.]